MTEASREAPEIMDDIPLALSEFVSRLARYNLVVAVLAALRDRDDNPVSPAVQLSMILNVSPRTTQRWASRGIQGCDPNIGRLIEIALVVCPSEVGRILRQDLEAHAAALKIVLEGRQGAVAP